MQQTTQPDPSSSLAGMAAVNGPLLSRQPLEPATPETDLYPTPASREDPIPNPEPATPSLDEPDPGVFHHNPTRQPD
jgi:hypothetical protein